MERIKRHGAEALVARQSAEAAKASQIVQPIGCDGTMTRFDLVT